MEAPVDVVAWAAAHEASFAPPVCNKLLYKGQLTVMFVGGPNTREDFHLEAGSEFFWQMRGAMELPTVQRGQRKLVRIEEGHVFCLPPRVPHSPQRPEQGSLGLVIERARAEGELDALRFYTDFHTCEAKLWERYFQCEDLGKDLGPVLQAFNASEEARTRTCTATSLPAERLIAEDEEVAVPEPFHLLDWVAARADVLATEGASLELFPGHPDGEFKATVMGTLVGEPNTQLWQQAPRANLEVFLHMLVGTGDVEVAEKPAEGETQGVAQGVVQGEDEVVKRHAMSAGSCFVVPSGAKFKMRRAPGAACLRLVQAQAARKQT